MLKKVSHVKGGLTLHSQAISSSKSLIENKRQTMKMNDVTEPSKTAVTMMRGAFMRGLEWMSAIAHSVSIATYFGISAETVSSASRVGASLTFNHM